MKIAKEQVEYTAKLANLKLSNEEVNDLCSDMARVLEYAQKINELDTQNVRPMAHVLDNVNSFRNDEVKKGLSIEETLKNAPDSEERMFKTPKVL